MRTKQIIPIVLAGIAFNLLSTSVLAQTTTPTVASESQPTSHPTSKMPLLISPPKVAGNDPLAELYAKLQLTPRDEMVLSQVRNGTQSVEEAGFYLMMSKLEHLPALNDKQYAELLAPPRSGLLRNPKQFQFQPIRANIRIYYVKKLTTNHGISTSPYWPEDRPMYLIHGTFADAKTKAEQDQQPVVLYSYNEPPALPEPDKVIAGELRGFSGGPEYEVAGVFYKYFEDMDQGDADGENRRLRQYPVLLAWQIQRKYQLIADVDWTTRFYVIGGILLVALVLGVGFFITLKRRVKRSRTSPPGRTLFKNYTPLRDGDDELADEEQIVDPALADAARAYRQEHGLDENTPKEG